MNKILTVSIAAYNVEKYIETALDSLIVEDIIDEIEIFVIDDGGTDKTLEIAREYAKKYPNSIYCIHKGNGGYGSTINLSVQKASGKYFKQLDGDDWFYKDDLKDFINILKQTSADVVLTNSRKYYEVDNQYAKGLEYNHFLEGEFSIEESNLDTRFSMHTVTFRTNILKNHMKNLTEHSLYTDAEFIMYPIPYLNTIYISHLNIYIYRIGREEQSFSSKSIQKHYKEMENVFSNCLSIYKSIDSSSKTKKQIALKILCTRMEDQFNFFLLLPVSIKALNEIKNYKKMAENECPEVLNEAKKQSKVIKLLLNLNYLLYPLLCLWIRRKWRKA